MPEHPARGQKRARNACVALVCAVCGRALTGRHLIVCASPACLRVWATRRWYAWWRSRQAAVKARQARREARQTARVTALAALEAAERDVTALEAAALVRADAALAEQVGRAGRRLRSD